MTATPKVLLHVRRPDEAAAIVTRHHPDMEVAGCDTHAALPAALAREQPEIVYTVRFEGDYPRSAMLGAPTVKWISVGGSGTDHLLPWDTDRLVVTNSAGVAADMMAEYVIGTMLSFSLNLPGFARAQARREWIDGRVRPVAGQTLLIVGLGKTGHATARLAKAMGLTVLGVRANPKPTPNVDEVHSDSDLLSVLPRADYVVLCLPLLPATRGLMDEAAFAAMKPSAILIDVSRGGVADEAALTDALQTGAIAGAALDVFATEPLPAEHPLWTMENVLITPHCSSVYDGWEARSVEMFCQNLARWRRGEPLENVVDPARGY